MLSLVCCSAAWPSQKVYMKRNIEGCDSFQCSKSVTQKPFCKFEILPIPAGPCTDISYNLITGLPMLDGSNSILTVFYWLTKKCCFSPCRETMVAEKLPDLIYGTCGRYTEQQRPFSRTKEVFPFKSHKVSGENP